MALNGSEQLVKSVWAQAAGAPGRGCLSEESARGMGGIPSFEGAFVCELGGFRKIAA